MRQGKSYSRIQEHQYVEQHEYVAQSGSFCPKYTQIHPLDTWISKEPHHLDKFLGSKEPPEFLIQNPATEVISGKVLLQVFVRHQLGLLVGATELQQLAVQATKFAMDPVEAMDPLDPCGPRSEAF